MRYYTYYDTVLDKDIIGIIPRILRAKRGFPQTVSLVEIVNAILYKLKTGVQWHQLYQLSSKMSLK